MEFVVEFWGHRNVTALHPTTIEVTKEEHLTPRGDCIIGVRASASVNDLPPEMKREIRSGKIMEIQIVVEDHRFSLTAFGHRDLSLSHPTDIVIRKSSFISDRTLAIRSSAAAIDVPRNIIRLLQQGSPGRMIIRIQ
ncbi:MAG: DUF371 domain-containing protein [Nitrososphaeria archaeon]